MPNPLKQSPLVNQALAYWRGLQARERVLIAAASVLLLITLVYALLWVPMQRDLRHLRVALPEAEAHLAQMRGQLALVQQLKASRPATGSSVSLQTAVEQSATAAGINSAISRLETRGPKTVDVSLDNVAFNNIVRWLSDLQKKHPIQIETATVDRQSAPGTVNVRLTLRTSSS